MSIRSLGPKSKPETSAATALPARHSTSAANKEVKTVPNRGGDDPKGPLGLNLLYSSSEPVVDLVFVHGLGGGSRKTWSKTTSTSHYWPQEWLPKDPAFKRVRIHSFGYNSDWAKGKDNCWDIHHFGKSLLGEISTSPHLADGDIPIVLVGHSMGGLVIKKAYMLARQVATYAALAKRIHSIYFLATPHRGCDSAKLLRNILLVAYRSRAYVADLTRNSRTIQIINDGFRNYAKELELWCFYETQKMKMGLLSTIIVDPDSATLGYPEEKQMPMNADHRSICKFDTVSDPNYVVLRNALASTVSNLSQLVLESREQLHRNQIKDLERYLGMVDGLEDDLATAEDARIPGSCGWLSERGSYQKWKDFDSDAPSILWVNGKPAAGKSVLAGYAINQLQKVNAGCSYFFFRHGDKSKSRLGTCLRSIAFQMACKSTNMRSALVEMQRDEVGIDKDNARAIWRKLFLSGIFQSQVQKQYWVIDGLDECVDPATLFDVVLAEFNNSIPIRILITSRQNSDLEKGFKTLGNHRFQNQRISATDTLPDIKLLVEAKAKFLLVKNDDDRVVLINQILAKSQGSFLWTVLVLKELSNSYSKEETTRILDEMPRDMTPLYQRTLDLMSQASRGKHLAKTILAWATCAARPLTTTELDGALKLDVNEKFLKLDETIMALCGQLVTIDKFGKVQMVHETAREFLLGNDLVSNFAIKKKEAHTQIAKACLKCLTSDELKPPRSGRRGRTLAPTGSRSHFSLYACEAFSYHLADADPLDNDILSLVHKFLDSNVLSWIDIIAQARDLTPLIRTAKNLRTYLNSCSAERSPLGREMRSLRGWSTDLVRIAAKFADALITSPSAIYSLIPPFCPSESTIYNTKIPGRRLSVVGVSNAQWDDKMSCIDFNQRQTTAICYGDKFFAVGLLTGEIMLFHASSYQEHKSLDHGEAVKLLQFKSGSDIMASCGMKTIQVWRVRSGELIHTFETPHRSMYLGFDNNKLIAASYQNYMMSWDLDSDGARKPDRPWTDSDRSWTTPVRRPPCAISISVAHKMMAVAYSGRPIILWDLEQDAYYDTCGKKLPDGETTTSVVSALVFNPNGNIGLLAVSYLDGELVLLDPFGDREIESFRAECHTLAASPNGRLLAGGGAFGTVQIYDFDNLRLLYRVKASDFYIKQLAFSRDSLHFADIRGSQCNVWEPTALVQDLIGEDSSEGTAVSIFDAVAPDPKVKISAMTLHPDGTVAFCGQEDGSVSSYEVKTGARLRTLYTHKSLVRILTWWPQKCILMSVDASNGIIAWKLQKVQHDGWLAEKLLFQSRLNSRMSIIQSLPGEEAGKFILSTRDSDYFWSIDGQQENARACSEKPGVRKWIQHPQSPLHLICIDGATATIYSWNDWSEIASVAIAINTHGLQLKNATAFLCSGQPRILLEQCEIDGPADTRGVQVIDAGPLGIASTLRSEGAGYEAMSSLNAIDEGRALRAPVAAAISGPQLAALAPRVSHIIGFSDTGRMVFLDKYSWVCSVDLGELDHSPLSFVRHFFVPHDWFFGTRDVICALIKRDAVFARNDGVAIVQSGLEYIEKVDLECT